MWAFRVRLERMSQTRYRELDVSKDPFDKIHNGQVLHYTRCDPNDPTGNTIAPYANWMRSVLPENMKRSRNDWETIVRPNFSNEDLLTEVGKIPRIIKG
jgi:NAD+ kinase